MLTASVDVTIRAFGLAPGKKYESSWEFMPGDGGAGFNEGWSAQAVKSNGTFTQIEDWSTVSGNRAGTVHVWLREPGSGFGGAPSLGPDGQTLEVTVSLP